MTLKMHDYDVVEDNGGGLDLFVFRGPRAHREVQYAHSDYEYARAGQLIQDLDGLDSGADTESWDGCEDDPQSVYDSLANWEAGDWVVVAEGTDGHRELFPERMCFATKQQFGIDGY